MTRALAVGGYSVSCSADLFGRSAARPLLARKSRGPNEQVRATPLLAGKSRGPTGQVRATPRFSSNERWQRFRYEK